MVESTTALVAVLYLLKALVAITRIRVVPVKRSSQDKLL